MRRRHEPNCPSCLVTPIAEWLLERAARDLARSRGAHGWSVVRCERCGRISSVVDDLAESVFGAPVPGAFDRSARRHDIRLQRAHRSDAR